MNTSVNIAIGAFDPILCRNSKTHSGRGVIEIGIMNIYGSFDQLEQIRGAIDAYLYEHRPPLVIVGSRPEVAQSRSGADFVLSEMASTYEVPREPA